MDRRIQTVNVIFKTANYDRAHVQYTIPKEHTIIKIEYCKQFQLPYRKTNNILAVTPN